MATTTTRTSSTTTSTTTGTPPQAQQQQLQQSQDPPFTPLMNNTSSSNGHLNHHTAEAMPLLEDADTSTDKTLMSIPAVRQTQQQQQHQTQNYAIKSPPISSSAYYNPKTNQTVYQRGSMPPRSANASLASLRDAATSDLEFFEDMVSDPVLVLGVDISHLDRNSQFFVCAAGVFGFSLLYGYLQELISVRICGRQLGLFLAMVQFTGYTILAFIMRNFVYAKQQRHLKRQHKRRQQRKQQSRGHKKHDDNDEAMLLGSSTSAVLTVPLLLYLGLSILRAIDLGMTNMAMQYINYPAKTLMKSSRVVFTMLFGVVISRKKYKPVDYAIVFTMVFGLALFMHADANSSAVFDLSGVAMLTVSLLCDGAISNVSETIMSKFNVGQDEFIFRMYSIALVAITIAAAVKGDMKEGFYWMQQPGTYDELDKPLEERTWTVAGKITVMVLFSSMGFFGSSCSAAITKNFGALTMSITSTARKAATLFLSFFLFNNVCTIEHILGVVVFIAALTAKSLRRSKHGKKSARQLQQQNNRYRTFRSQDKRLGSTADSSSLASSVASDISDVELGSIDSGIEETEIPSVVHTDNLRSRNYGSPSKNDRNHHLISSL